MSLQNYEWRRKMEKKEIERMEEKARKRNLILLKEKIDKNVLLFHTGTGRNKLRQIFIYGESFRQREEAGEMADAISQKIEALPKDDKERFSEAAEKIHIFLESRDIISLAEIHIGASGGTKMPAGSTPQFVINQIRHLIKKKED